MAMIMGGTDRKEGTGAQRLLFGLTLWLALLLLGGHGAALAQRLSAFGPADPLGGRTAATLLHLAPPTVWRDAGRQDGFALRSLSRLDPAFKHQGGDGGFGPGHSIAWTILRPLSSARYASVPAAPQAQKRASAFRARAPPR